MPDLAKIMTEAWELAKGRDATSVAAILWAEADAAGRRRLFRAALCRAWSRERARVPAAAVTLTARDCERLTLECKDRWTPADYRRADELRFAA